MPLLVKEIGRLADNVAGLNETLRLRDGVGSGGHPKLCIKCGAELMDPQLRGDERCDRCGD
ncbi:MAG: hypothetical protein GY946_25060 [bacterium]|nr:hypothetical protein [bacterium]